jgi:4-hydroxy-tetrahydrodipicolinate synthase
MASSVGGGYLVAVPQNLYGSPDALLDFFRDVARGIDEPMMIQDLQWHGPGLSTEMIERLAEEIPAISGVKIETVPAGPAYTSVIKRFDNKMYVCAGWAVTQLIEALDRGVHAVMPEASMVPVYRAILDTYRAGNRAQAIHDFRALLPILSFTNQEIAISIAFFKLLLLEKSIVRSDTVRIGGFTWDRFNRAIAEELVDYYQKLELNAAALTSDCQ